MRLCFCSIIWIVGVVNCELDRRSWRSQFLSTCLEQSNSISGGPTAFSIRKFRATKAVESHAEVVGQRTTFKRGDVLSLRGGGGCLSCFPRNPAKQKQNILVSLNFDVYFNTTATNFTKFSPGILGSCETLGKWAPNQVRILDLRSVLSI